MTKSLFLLALSGVLLFAGCKKDKNDNNQATQAVSVDAMLSDFAGVVVIPKYETLKNEAATLKADAQNFIGNASESNLATLRADWLNTRQAWETTESFLFGPVATENLDPSIDDWPVNYVDLDSVMGTVNNLTPAYIASLSTSLKGFHAIEYLIYGRNSMKKAADFTQREKDYLGALTTDLAAVTTTMYTSWDPSQGNYKEQLTKAGKGSATYLTQKDAVVEIANAIIGIVDEVGSGKISEPFNAYDSTLEESQFSKNSFTDFRNNIAGAKNAYLCSYNNKAGVSLSAFVQQYNKSLDLNITQKFDAVIANLGNYSVPFGVAIYSQRPNVSNTIAALEDLKTTLESNLIPLIQQHVK